MKTRRGYENQIADNLPRLESLLNVGEHGHMREEFPFEQLLALEVTELPWYADIVNYLDSGLFPPGAY